MSRSIQHGWLDRFAWLTAGATFLLIGIGGLVTSKGAGMAVPDWPTTYGYNMFLFPIRLWGSGTGVFYEHTHRLFASFVGFLTTILALWLWFRESRAWLRWLGVAAFFAVVLQGVLGGLRVTLLKDQIGILHAALAQAFLVLVTLIALATSGVGERWLAGFRNQALSLPLRRVVLCSTLFIAVQLILGATMRHQHAGLAIPDFPLAYGQWWPSMEPQVLDQINRTRLGIHEYRPITAFQIGLHMTHRLMALAILAGVATAVWMARRELAQGTALRRWMWGWLGLVCLQGLLGALTVWSNKAADVATAHVLLGALSLLSGALLSLGAIQSARVSQMSTSREFALDMASGARLARTRRTTA